MKLYIEIRCVFSPYFGSLLYHINFVSKKTVVMIFTNNYLKYTCFYWPHILIKFVTELTFLVFSNTLITQALTQSSRIAARSH